MLPPFDIFKVAEDGSPHWVEAARTLDLAKARIQEFMASSPTEYIIFSQTTGNKFSIKPDGAG
jgi:hypothetical protein